MSGEPQPQPAPGRHSDIHHTQPGLAGEEKSSFKTTIRENHIGKFGYF